MATGDPQTTSRTFADIKAKMPPESQARAEQMAKTLLAKLDADENDPEKKAQRHAAWREHMSGKSDQCSKTTTTEDPTR